MKLGLGTAQFGSDYGISNIHGKPPLDETRKILQVAKQYGLNLIDTATSYGDSEKVLGQVLPEIYHFDVVTKTPHFSVDQIRQENADALIETFTDSLSDLQQHKTYGLLIHNADNLLMDGSNQLMDAMQALKQQGLVSKVGVSVYNEKQIELLLERYQIDLIQVPINVLDQRLVAHGLLNELKQAGVEVHARSVFLQGLLLMRLDDVNEYFSPIMMKLNSYHSMLNDYGLSPLQGALAYVKSLNVIDYAILGVSKAQELEEICTAFNALPDKLPDWSSLAVDDETMINPAFWPKK